MMPRLPASRHARRVQRALFQAASMGAALKASAAGTVDAIKISALGAGTLGAARLAGFTLGLPLGMLAGLAALVVSAPLDASGSRSLDEVSLFGPTEVIDVVEGTLSRSTWNPEDFGIATQPADRIAELSVPGPKESAAAIRDVLAGATGPRRRSSSTARSRSSSRPRASSRPSCAPVCPCSPPCRSSRATATARPCAAWWPRSPRTCATPRGCGSLIRGDVRRADHLGPARNLRRDPRD